MSASMASSSTSVSGGRDSSSVCFCPFKGAGTTLNASGTAIAATVGTPCGMFAGRGRALNTEMCLSGDAKVRLHFDDAKVQFCCHDTCLLLREPLPGGYQQKLRPLTGS